MNIKQILFIGLLLVAVISIATTAASQDIDENLTVPQETDGIDLSIDQIDEDYNADEVEVTLSASEDEDENIEANENEDTLKKASIEGSISFHDEVTVYESGFGNVLYISYLPSYYSDFGNISISIDDEKVYNGSVESYHSVFTMDLLKVPSYGMHKVTYNYTGCAYYEPFVKTQMVNFTYAFSLNVFKDYEINNITIQVYLPQLATGNVTIRVNNKTYENVDLRNAATLSLSIDEFNLGRNQLFAYYQGDAIHPPKHYSTSYYLYPTFKSTNLIIDGEEGFASVFVPKHESGIFVLSIDYTDYYTFPRVINRTVVGEVEVENGTASIKLPEFDGERRFYLEFFGSINDYTTDKVISTASSLDFQTIATTNITQGQNAQIRLINNYHENAIIHVQVDGMGVMSYYELFNLLDISIPDLSVGNHTISIRTDFYSPIHFSKIFNITVNERVNVSADATNNDTAANSISNSSTVDSAVKNLTTPVSVDLKTQNVQNKINLALKSVKVKKSAKKIVLKATLKVNGALAKSKYVIFKFNGKTYKVKTNSKGVAKLTLKKSILKKLKVGKKVSYQVSYSNKIVKRTTIVKK